MSRIQKCDINAIHDINCCENIESLIEQIGDEEIKDTLGPDDIEKIQRPVVKTDFQKIFEDLADTSLELDPKIRELYKLEARVKNLEEKLRAIKEILKQPSGR